MAKIAYSLRMYTVYPRICFTDKLESKSVSREEVVLAGGVWDGSGGAVRDREFGCRLSPPPIHPLRVATNYDGNSPASY